MAVPLIKTSYAAGELSPSIWGHLDFQKVPAGCATLRNCFVNYRGGASSRAGTKFVGAAKQPGLDLPPRLIRFAFNIYQTYHLEFGDYYMRVVSNGGYVVETPKVITAASQTNPCTITSAAHGFSNGDWVFIADVVGMTQLNGRTFIVAGATANTFNLTDTFGTNVSALTYATYVSGGTVARIFTLTTPYAVADLPYLKFAQSADVMFMTCVNPITLTEYAPQSLVRHAPANWTIASTDFSSQIAPPTSLTAVASNVLGANATTYQYVVTAIDSIGHESIASLPGTCSNSVDMATTAGSVTVTWDPVVGATSYNVYRAPAGVFGATVPIGSVFGFAGTADGTQFVDSNIIPDFITTPPTHENPFARGQAQSATRVSGGAAYVQATTTATITSGTGSGAVLFPVVVGGIVVAIIFAELGEGYLPGDLIVIADSGGGTGADYTLNVGPQTGTYPGVVGFFQGRLVYGDTLNNPDTYFMSRPGQYTNFDTSSPPVDTDAITGSPWAQQVNGIQWFLGVPAGMLVGTGQDAWLVQGIAGTGSPITPSSQSATPQEAIGFSATIPPIKIGADAIYCQSVGSVIRDIQYNFVTNVYGGTDLTKLSNHLFDGFELVQWTWAKEPYKLVWVIRGDGRLLSMTYLKEQDEYGWARHDTNGQFVAVSSATELPVDAVYFIVRRNIPNKGWAYYTERMDNRLWQHAQDCWCVDCGLNLPMTKPNAMLQPVASTGTSVQFTASASVFTSDNIGDVIRVDGGSATITSVPSGNIAIADIGDPLAIVVTDDPNNTPVLAKSGEWTVSTPVQKVEGLDHLEGMLVTGLADGAVIIPRTVTNGAITLDNKASNVVVGLAYLPQVQTLHQEAPGGATIQGKRKKAVAATIRMERSRGISVGTDQPNASAQEHQQDVPWQYMQEIQEEQASLPPGSEIELFTGDKYVILESDWDTPGMIAMQQNYPLPMNVLASVPIYEVGDSNG